MFGTLKTLITGASARSEETLRDVYAIELIDQKIREAMENLKAAKMTLVSLIQRERAEAAQIEKLERQVADLMERTKQAMAAGRDDLAGQAAQSVADMENELTARRATLQRLELRVERLRQTVETAHRRIVDLKQGAVTARAIRREQSVQKRLVRSSGTSPMEEAESLIEGVLNKDDPFEQGEILREIDLELGHGGIADRMAEAGFGAASKSTAADILTRLKADA